MRRFEGYHPSFLDPSYRHVSSMNGHQQSFIEEEKYSLASSPATSHAIALEKVGTPQYSRNDKFLEAKFTLARMLVECWIFIAFIKRDIIRA